MRGNGQSYSGGVVAWTAALTHMTRGCDTTCLNAYSSWKRIILVPLRRRGGFTTSAAAHLKDYVRI